jgi:hypothetical protein
VRGSACGDDLIYDYELDGGIRNVFCRALTVLSWKTFLAMAPVPPFLGGPHQNGKLDLHASTFGSYNPAFVTWATRTLLPAETDSALRKQTQPVYDKQLRHLARLYFLVDKAAATDPLWRVQQQHAPQDVADLFGDPAHNWGGHDPNLVGSAMSWWMRRDQDGTTPLWRDGLVRLLRTYDAAWLTAEQKRPSRASLPRATSSVPEYR